MLAAVRHSLRTRVPFKTLSGNPLWSQTWSHPLIVTTSSSTRGNSTHLFLPATPSILCDHYNHVFHSWGLQVFHFSTKRGHSQNFKRRGRKEKTCYRNGPHRSRRHRNPPPVIPPKARSHPGANLPIGRRGGPGPGQPPRRRPIVAPHSPVPKKS